MNNRPRLTAFLLIWLKKCIISNHEVVAVGVILPAVRLAHGVRIALVPAVIANTQRGLREVTTTFLKIPTKIPRVRLAYTCLVAWHMLHCPVLLTPMLLINAPEPFVQCWVLVDNLLFTDYLRDLVNSSKLSALPVSSEV